MKTIWSAVISGWNFMKVFRVLAGLLVIYSGIADNNITFLVIGAGFLIFSLLATGICCTAYTPRRHPVSPADLKNIEYEELDQAE